MSNRFRRSTFAISLGLLSACSAQNPESTASFEMPEPVHVEGSLLSAAVPDLHRSLDSLQKLADRILPEAQQFNLKAQIGGMVGDPELKGISPGNGAAMIWDGSLWVGLLECNPELSEGLSLMMNSMQMQTSHEGAYLLISPVPAGIEKGKTLAPQIQEKLLKRDLNGGVVYVRTAELVEKYRAQIDMMVIMMPNMMAASSAGMPETQAANLNSMARVVEGELRILTSLAEQLESLELLLEPRQESLTFSWLLSAKADTRMHALLTAPDLLQPDPKITTDVLPASLFEIEMFMGNPKALAAFFTGEAEQLIQDMQLDPEKSEKWIELTKLWPTFLAGSMAETVDMSKAGGMKMAYLISVTKEKELLEELAKLPGLMKPFMAMSDEMGMPVKMEMVMNAREHKGNPVHAYNFAYDLENMDPEMAAPLKEMGMTEMNSEFTIVNGRMIWTMGELPLNDLVDAVNSGKKGGATLEAKNRHPAGGICYYDMDLGRYFGFIQDYMPQTEPGMEVFNLLAEKFKQSPALTGAGFQQDHHALWSLDIPVEIMEVFVGFWAVESTTEF